MKCLILVASVFCLAAQAAIYVSPTGTPEGDGTLGSPKDLASALAMPGTGREEFRLLASDTPYVLTETIEIAARTLRGWNGATDSPAARGQVVVSGGGTVKCINSPNLNGGWTLADLTFVNGATDVEGGIIYAQNLTAANLITNCVFRDAVCSKPAIRATVYRQQDSLVFADCEFRNIEVKGWYGFAHLGPGDYKARLERCVIEGNRQTESVASYGSFMYGSADFTDCGISNNTSVAIGGFCIHDGRFLRCRFENNVNSNCGTCMYVFEKSGKCAIEDCEFVGNVCTATEWPKGGGCFAGGLISGNSGAGNLYVTICLFAGNSSAGSGAVLTMRNSADGSEAVFSGCVFTDNNSGECKKGSYSVGGGVLSLLGVNSVHLYGCKFAGNNSEGVHSVVHCQANVSGSATYELKNGTVRNCLFENNQSHGSNGGGNDGAVYFDRAAEIDCCTFVNNKSDKNLYGALYVGGSHETGPEKTVRNCIFSGNTSAYPNNRFSACNAVPTGDVRYWNCFSQNGFLPEGQGNIGGTAAAHADARFVDAANGDWRLAKGSPCINAGMNAEWMAGATKDLSNAARHPRRVEQSTVDIGCYEYWIETGMKIVIR